MISYTFNVVFVIGFINAIFLNYGIWNLNSLFCVFEKKIKQTIFQFLCQHSLSWDITFMLFFILLLNSIYRELIAKYYSLKLTRKKWWNSLSSILWVGNCFIESSLLRYILLKVIRLLSIQLKLSNL